jgi:hypothetical protein
MPVNWAFPAAQGEPESFLGIQGSIHRLRSFSLTAKALAAQSLRFCNRAIGPLLNVLDEFSHCTLKKLSTPRGRCDH